MPVPGRGRFIGDSSSIERPGAPTRETIVAPIIGSSRTVTGRVWPFDENAASATPPAPMLGMVAATPPEAANAAAGCTGSGRTFAGSGTTSTLAGGIARATFSGGGAGGSAAALIGGWFGLRGVLKTPPLATLREA